ncbi:MAG TPA: aminoacetone oxidase family FAD-binding enzyme [Thermoanaerobaculia bacterium]|nr:aminoacetone oxidase family FAD-binding enzyme [Thermoanaerobaculia bacterium]
MPEGTSRDVLVVGAGAAGFVAAIFARRSGASVSLLEATGNPGQKILISGGARCNVLPSRFQPERFVSETPKLAARFLKAWRLEAVRAFFEEDLRLPLVLEEESGKLFPATNRARDVRDALLREAEAAGVEVVRNARVVDVARSPLSVALAGGERRAAPAVVLATGGLSVPRTGSDGGGLAAARRLGHRIVEPYPALTPLRTDRAGHRALAGVSLPVSIRAEGGRSARFASSGGFLFTHAGYSGPAVLDLSHHVVRDPETHLRVAWSSLSVPEWEERLLRARGAAAVDGVVAREVPARLARTLTAEAGVEAGETVARLRREPRLRLIEALTRYRLPVSGHEGFARAEVTGGGVALDEVDPVTLESRRAPGLFLCGEILDAFGPIGGHNFLWAWVTGRSAGLAAGSAGRRGDASSRAGA